MKKIKVDFDLCESNAMCEALAPSHFQVDDDDFLQILEENVSDDDLAVVEQQAHKRIGIIVEPDKVASWDHRKMGAPPGA